MSKSENNRVIINHEICAQIEACIASCPESAIEMINGLPKLVKDCEAPCRECSDGCPANAISMK